MTSLKKSIAVLALSLPLAASAQQAAAPAPLYQIYGTLNVNGQWTEASKPYANGTNVTSRIAVSTDSTNIGIKGVADTGQFGLGVVYQCETSAAVDGQGVSGICNRNSRLGLTTAFGTIFYGNWDTPYKAITYGTKGDDAFGNTDVFDAAGIIGSPGFKTKSTASVTSVGLGTAAAPTASTTFNIRAANSIVYQSPKFQGLQVKAAYSANEFATDNGRISPQLWSIGANYDRGPLSVFGAYERHDDFMALNSVTAGIPGVTATPNNRTNQDQGIRVGAGYEIGSGFGTTTIGAVYEWLDYKFVNANDTVGGVATPANTVKEASRSAVMVNLKHRTGNHEFRARFEKAENIQLKFRGPGTFPDSFHGSGASNYALGYAYYLTSAAQVYGYFTKIENDRFATYTFATAGNANVTSDFSGGADPMAVGLGMRYAF